jgi:hypothetical protein
VKKYIYHKNYQSILSRNTNRSTIRCVHFWFICLCQVLIFFLAAGVFYPVFFKAQLTTVYEYLGKRFDKKTRLLGSFLYVLRGNITLPVFIYGPALALINRYSSLVINVSTYLFFSYRCKSFGDCFRDKFNLCLLHCHRWFEDRRLDRCCTIRRNHDIYCCYHLDRCKINRRLLNCVEHSTCRRKT